MHKSIYVAIIAIIAGVAIHYYQLYPWKSSTTTTIGKSIQSDCLKYGDHIFTKQELSQYKQPPRILLGFLGVVYDVSSSPHYSSKGSYGFFAGIDGTRAFLTGEFTENELYDDITDLEDSYFNGIDTWVNLYENKYKRLGVLVGAYFDDNGCPTAKHKKVQHKIEKAKINEKEDQDEINQYPPCNTEWDSMKNQGRFWCSAMSGGIQRSWIGKPRLFYQLSSKSWRCACIENDTQHQFCHGDSNETDQQTSNVDYIDTEQSHQPNCRLKHYANCDIDSFECMVKD